MKKRALLHSLLFGIYPIAFLYSQNLHLDLGWEFLRPTVLIVGLLVIAFTALVALGANLEKSALLISAFFLLFFSFGHLADQLVAFGISAKMLIAASVIALAGLTFWIVRTRQDLRGATVGANVVATALLAFPLVAIAASLVKAPAGAGWPRDIEQVQGSSVLQPDAPRPNVYYIILDAYGRQDVLREVFGYDNTGFVEDLRALGFYVADRSITNYAQTILSLSSSLNLDYLSEAVAGLEASSDRTGLMRSIRHNTVAAHLKSHGYEYVALTSGYQGVQIRNADRNLQPFGVLSEFETTLLNTTPLEEILLRLKWYDGWAVHRRRIDYIFDRLAEPQALNSPAFVLAHIVAPHPPFVFKADGTGTDPRRLGHHQGFFNDGIPGMGMELDEYKRGYAGQVAYLNTRLRAVLGNLISAAKTPPIIILQGDHGPSSGLSSQLSNPNPENLRERMSILNALYLPGDGARLLYPQLSPVNSFRIVLNEYFGASYEKLPDRSYFSTWDTPFQFVDVTSVVAAE